MARKITRKGLERKLDKLIREIVFLRDASCVTCPIWKEIKPEFVGSPIMQPGHYFTRGALSVKWDLRNVYKQCKTCNFLHQYHREILAKHVLDTLGEKGFKQLILDAHKTRRWVMPELQELYKELYNEFLSCY